MPTITCNENPFLHFGSRVQLFSKCKFIPAGKCTLQTIIENNVLLAPISEENPKTTVFVTKQREIIIPIKPIEEV
jgi:hypothetical protein